MSSSFGRLKTTRGFAALIAIGVLIISCSIYRSASASTLIAQNESSKSASASKAKPKKAKPKQKSKTTDLTGTWYYEIDKNQHRGYIHLYQSGSTVSGTWHTTSKQEDDTPVLGQVNGNMLIMTRSKVWGSHDQNFNLTVINNNQISGYGEGFFLNHTDLRMARVPNR